MATKDEEKQPAKVIDDLKFYQLALKLLRAAYKMAAEVPDYEKYNLASAEAQKSLNGYIRYLRRKKQGRGEFGDKFIREDGVVYEVHLTSDAPDSLIPSFPDHPGEDL